MLSHIPFYYEQINSMRGSKIPEDISFSSDTYFFFWRSLYQRLASRFKWIVPEHWEKEIFEFMLYGLGFVGIFDTDKYATTPNQRFGIIPAPSTLSGIGVQMQPTRIKTANPKFYMPYSETIYEGAGLVKLTGDYKGVLDIVDFYAERLSILYSTIDQSIINTRFAYIVGANSDVAAATLKALFDQRNSGRPLMVFDYEKLKTVKPNKAEAVLDKSEPFHFLDLEVGRNYVTDKLLADYRRIMCAFDSEIGIPNNPVDKAERLISNEVESNSADTVSRSEYWMDCLERSIKRTKSVFPELKLSVTFRDYDTGQTGAKEAKLVGGEADVK